jgi:hypothetical protein
MFVIFSVVHAEPNGRWKPPFTQLIELSSRQKKAICELVKKAELQEEFPQIARMTEAQQNNMQDWMKLVRANKDNEDFPLKPASRKFNDDDGNVKFMRITNGVNKIAVTRQVHLTAASLTSRPYLEDVDRQIRRCLAMEEKKVRGKRKIDKAADAANEAAKKNKGYVDEDGMIIFPKGNTVHEISAPPDATIVLSWNLPSGATSSVEFPAAKVFSIYVKNPTKDSEVPESMLRLQ